MGHRCALLLAAALACGQAGDRVSAQVGPAPSPSNPAPTALTVEPSQVRLAGGATQQFSASEAVTWAADSGSIDASGLYTAPAADGTFEVTATSLDKSRTAIAHVTVTLASPPPPPPPPPPPGEISITIAPQSVTLTEGQQYRFIPSVIGTGNRQIEFSVDGGSIDADGLYTAPVTPGTFHVTVTSVADRSRQAVATVTVTPPVVAVTFSPKEDVVYPGNVSIQLHATVTGSSDTAIIWSIQEGAAGGTIDQNGMYKIPPNVEGTWHVIATAHADPTKSDVMTITASWQPLVDHGGALLAAPRVYAIWWGDPAGWASDSRSGIEEVLSGLAGSGYLDVTNQYFRGATPGLSFAGSLTDTSPVPASFNFADAADEVCKVVTEPDPAALYLVFTSAPLQTSSGGCAWHASMTCNGATFALALLPNTLGSDCIFASVTTCDAGISAATQSLASLTAHETLEAMTDPFGSGWWYDGGGTMEIADKCGGRVRACVPIAGHQWGIQGLWSNATHECLPK